MATLRSCLFRVYPIAMIGTADMSYLLYLAFRLSNVSYFGHFSILIFQNLLNLAFPFSHLICLAVLLIYIFTSFNTLHGITSLISIIF